MAPFTKNLQTAAFSLALAFAFGASVSPAYAKNKENCHAIGGKWLPGSTTNPEKGACLFLIRANKPALDATKTRATDGMITADECTRKGGKISRDRTQCSMEMRN
jgi:hypothetical protein